MQGFGRKVRARRDDAAFVIAIRAHDVEGGGGSEIDDDERALVGFMRRDGVDQAVRANRIGAIHLDADAEIDVSVADDHGFAFEIFAAEHAQVEQRSGNDGGDNGRVDIGEAKARERDQRLEQDGVFIGRARGFGDGAPFGAHFLAVINREDDVGVTGVDGEQHIYYPKKTSPAAIARVLPCVSRRMSAPVSSMPSNMPQISPSARRARMRVPRPAARASHASRNGENPLARQISYHFAKAAARRARASLGFGAVMPNAGNAVAGNSVPSG